uniref:Hexosyltransferase n=1 Tax=Macrostomum lignano TaxID=282301 RepID=A0A1I8FAW9_9PLAT
DESLAPSRGASLNRSRTFEGGDDTDSLANPASDIQGGFVQIEREHQLQNVPTNSHAKNATQNRSLLSCIAFLAILGLCYPVFHFLLFDTNSRGATSVDELTAERQRRLHPSLRLESWGECFQAAPNLLVAVASSQADLAGRDQLRRLWRRKWRLQSGAAQLVFFVRYAASAPRDLVVEEFHRRQDLMLNAALEWQTDAAMLRWATAWYLERCPRTPYLLFVGDWPALNVRLVALHTAGGGVGAALAERHNVTAASVRQQGQLAVLQGKTSGDCWTFCESNSTQAAAMGQTSQRAAFAAFKLPAIAQERMG